MVELCMVEKIRPISLSECVQLERSNLVQLLIVLLIDLEIGL